MGSNMGSNVGQIVSNNYNKPNKSQYNLNSIWISAVVWEPKLLALIHSDVNLESNITLDWQ